MLRARVPISSCVVQSIGVVAHSDLKRGLDLRYVLRHDHFEVA